TATPAAADVQVGVSVSNAHPKADEVVTATGTIKVKGQPAQASILFKWYLPTGIATCYVLTNSQGVGTCTQTNSKPLSGWVVQVQAIFTFNGQTFTTVTSYTQ